MTRVQLQDEDVEYVNVRPIHHREPPSPANFYEKWVDQSSAKHATPELTGADILREMYPGHSLVISEDFRLNLFDLPGLTVHPAKPDEPEPVSSLAFTPVPRRVAGELSGSLVDQVVFGSYNVTWNNNDFIVHIAKYLNGNFIRTVHFILHDGPEQPARDLVLSACLYANQVHEEIWVFNQNYWSKDKSLWHEIQDSAWDDVIMKEESKNALQKDIYGFFKSEKTYKKLAIPWKRGLILYGPPGNGKTISIKVIMKTCTERGFTPLYIKSFQGYQGEEASMQAVFQKARQLAPCVLILEDLDSLINDKNRSFFLNQLDGLEGNDGLLVIASTNHFDRLDPGLSSRPSRFDRKYLFADPDRQERVLYAKYWQKKLKDNDEIYFSDSLVGEIADLTQGFSFAYLKEAFVSTLVQLTNTDDDEGVPFSHVLKGQIITLRRELGKQGPSAFPSFPPGPLFEPTCRNYFPHNISEELQRTSLQEAKPPLPPPARGSKQPPFPIMTHKITPTWNEFDDDALSVPLMKRIAETDAARPCGKARLPFFSSPESSDMPSPKQSPSTNVNLTSGWDSDDEPIPGAVPSKRANPRKVFSPPVTPSQVGRPGSKPLPASVNLTVPDDGSIPAPALKRVESCEAETSRPLNKVYTALGTASSGRPIPRPLPPSTHAGVTWATWDGLLPPRSTEEVHRVCGRPGERGSVLHAPPSAYPQVMPGALPWATGPGGPMRPAWRTVVGRGYEDRGGESSASSTA